MLLAWLAIAFIWLSAYAVHYVLILILFGDHVAYYTTGLNTLSYIVVGALLIRAGYAFGTITSHSVQINTGPHTFFGKPKLPEQTAEATEHPTSIDIVIYAAQFASNPKAIDPLLDRLRIISAQQQPDQSLTPQENAQLMDVYMRLEHYLIHDDPVRRYVQSELRNAIQAQLHLTGVRAASTFWSKL